MTPYPWNRINSSLCNLVHVAARVDINAGGAVNSTTSLAPPGAVWSSPGTGRYLLTFPEPFPSANLMIGSPILESATAQDLVPQISAVTATTIEIRVNTGATATAPAAACKIHLNLLASNSTVQA